MSAPRPVMPGSTWPCTAHVAIAASIALPPAFRIRMPASAASGCPAATIPCCATTVGRQLRSCAEGVCAIGVITMAITTSEAHVTGLIAILRGLDYRPASAIRIAGMRRPVFLPAVLVDDQRSRARRQHLKRFEELDDAVLFVLAQRLEREPRRAGFTVVRLHCLTQRREHAVVKGGVRVDGHGQIWGADRRFYVGVRGLSIRKAPRACDPCDAALDHSTIACITAFSKSRPSCWTG